MNQKPLFLAVVLTALLVIGGVFWLMQKRPVVTNQPVVIDPVVETPNQTELENSIDTSDWKTYRNEEYGFEMKYPKNWEIDTERSTSNEVVFNTGHLESREAISFERNTKNISATDWVRANQVKHEGVILNESKMPFAGIEAQKIETGEMAQSYIVFSTDQVLYVITTMGLIEKNNVLNKLILSNSR